MGMTLTEKILAAHAGLDEVVPGQEISVKVDRIFLEEESFSRVLEDPACSREGAVPSGPERIVVAIDQSVGSCDPGRGDRVRRIRKVAGEWRIHPLYDLGRGGFENVIFPDGGLVRPGDLLVIGNGQRVGFGALGALAFRLEGEALVEAVCKGRITLKVPGTVRLVFRGKLNAWVGGKDLALEAFGLMGRSGAAGKVLEFSGEGVKNLEVAERLALAAFASNLEAVHILIEPDEKTRVFSSARCDRPFHFRTSDRDAGLDDILEIDAATIEPRLGIPFQPERVLSVSKARNMDISQVIIGTGGNGRIEDFRTAAMLLREYRIRRYIRLIVIPGSQQVYLHAMEEGLMQIFLRNGAHIGPPSSRYTDQCHLSGLAPDERCLTTSGKLYPVGDGGAGGEILYCNPAIAAASAVMGRVADPFEMMRIMKRKPTGIIG